MTLSFRAFTSILLIASALTTSFSCSSTSTPPPTITNNYYPPSSPLDASLQFDAGVDANYDAGLEADTSMQPPPPPICIPIASCAQVSVQCGKTGNGCGGVLDCGACQNGGICNDGVCGSTPCTPNTCMDGQCGMLSDGCSGVLNCSCTNGDVCIVNSNSCCLPESDMAFCASLGKNCGTATAPDNCGTVRTVASCGSLRFTGKEELDIADGVPVELTGPLTSIHIGAWINLTGPVGGGVPSSPRTNIINLGSSFVLGISPSGFLALNGSSTTIKVPLNQWVLVFANSAHILVQENSLGMIDTNGNIQSSGLGAPPFPTNNLIAGSLATLGVAFIGQMNNVRFWSVSISDLSTDYHNCLSVPQPGMVSQWCMLEGSGPTIMDGVSGTTSLLNTTLWDTETCF
jgi:hypothetical protein